MSDNTMKVQLQLSPVRTAFAPKTFALLPTEKVRIDLIGSSSTAVAPSSDNGIFPSSTLSQHPAQIISHGSYFSFKTSSPNSNSIMVNGHLLSNHTHTLRDGDQLNFGRAVLVRYDEDYDDDGDYECWPVFEFTSELSILVHITFPPRFDTRRVWTDLFADPVVYVSPSSIKHKISPLHTSTKASPSPKPTPSSGRAASARVATAKPAGPGGTDWDGVNRLIEELQAAPRPAQTAQHPPPSPSNVSSPPCIQSPASPLEDKRLGQLQHEITDTFHYGAFVHSSSALPAKDNDDMISTGHGDGGPAGCGHPLPGTPDAHTPADNVSSTRDMTSVLISVLEPPVAPIIDVPPPGAHTSIKFRSPASPVIDSAVYAFGSSAISPKVNSASVNVASANLAVQRILSAWVQARGVVLSFVSASTSFILTLERIRSAWLQARRAVGATVSTSAASVANDAPIDALHPLGSVAPIADPHCALHTTERAPLRPAAVPLNPLAASFNYKMATTTALRDATSPYNPLATHPQHLPQLESPLFGLAHHFLRFIVATHPFRSLAYPFALPFLPSY
ncbi:hypothetical protein A4X06_0g6781 [Tilletia controversa]|uniref:FHA domain-containing protein n=1 Tax=Tilletia controversa TaxID=13291 RepID=A0A8X7MNE1_9BASI|nr:hypothetical protein CF328_g6458 [Tilletia controversa]KAE8242730.1 hypothetical protein A4X06_0g6781 [Tilletia controversa]CAD6975137.1 unnamed protein product [Tilletia controversa]